MRRAVLLLAGVAFVVAACDQAPTETTAPDTAAESPAFAKTASSSVEAQMSAMLDDMNVALAAQGADYRALMIEYVTGTGDEAGATVVSKDVGNKQLTADFVPGDTRRAWDADPNAITYAVDRTGDAVPPVGGLTGAETDAAIDRAMGTWDAQTCSDLGLNRTDDLGLDLGYVAAVFGLGGSFAVVADVQHAGWLDIDFGGGVLGATFTIIWTDGGNPTDVDNNGKADVAFREVYYDPSFSWADDGVTNYDVEAVALHEAGHGLSQAHFGNIFVKNDGTLQRAPAAVMNPYILGQTRTLLGTDNGGHCSNWGQWPNN